MQEPKPPPPLTFQLLPALEEGFFSDLVIRSDDGFQVGPLIQIMHIVN